MRPMRIALTVGATLMAAAGVAVVVSVAAASPGSEKNDAFKMPAASAGPLSLAGGSASASPSPSPSATPTAVPTATATSAPAPTSTTAPVAKPAATARPAATAVPAAAPAPVAAAPAGQALPLGYSTGSATQVITVVASRTSSTTATLQAWDKNANGGWSPHGGAVTAHLGSQGMTTAPSESKSATPMGSFGLTRAFGANANPGTGLPYTQTTAADWWISQPGALYNTMQHCSGSCPFTQGNPNEHLRYETPYYNYAVVIDYNVSPVVQGAGSAFFLHVTDGTPTAGCVSIPQGTLTSIMQWLSPGRSPRILIGTA